MKKMRDLPTQDRPREKIAKRGASALSDTELIEAIIGRGTRSRDVREIAKEVCGIIREKGDLRYRGYPGDRGNRSHQGIPDHGLF